MWSASTPGEGEGLGLQLAEAADGVEDQCGLGGRGEGAEWPLGCPLRGHHGLETGPSFSPGPRDSDGSKVLRFDPDLLEHEVEFRGAGSCLPFRAKGQKVTIIQLQPVASGQSNIIDQSPC